jgi:hypothetical protein
MSDKHEDHDSDSGIDPEKEIRNIKEQLEFVAKTQALELLFRTLTPPHLLCANCGYDIDAWKYWETVILEQIERQKAMGTAHLLDQLERAHDVFFSECPECGEVADFRGDNA